MLRQNVPSILEYANVHGKRYKPTLIEIEIFAYAYALVDLLNSISGIYLKYLRYLTLLYGYGRLP